jgi:hypothetical protein
MMILTSKHVCPISFSSFFLFFFSGRNSTLSYPFRAGAVGLRFSSSATCCPIRPCPPSNPCCLCPPEQGQWDCGSLRPDSLSTLLCGGSAPGSPPHVPLASLLPHCPCSVAALLRRPADPYRPASPVAPLPGWSSDDQGYARWRVRAS